MIRNCIKRNKWIAIRSSSWVLTHEQLSFFFHSCSNLSVSSRFTSRARHAAGVLAIPIEKACLAHLNLPLFFATGLHKAEGDASSASLLTSLLCRKREIQLFKRTGLLCSVFLLLLCWHELVCDSHIMITMGKKNPKIHIIVVVAWRLATKMHIMM